ncbi:hypothetical protein BBK14_01860 [Parafrankia soli]|uniref:HK97 gp10 family phage protein n=1 Tax=Parafrankia soli TaxID=2599596 RepID=A0A1S1RKN1_9ACTN|nr:hypothetical protein [Parafrankia soli]OHV46617.1 hypothetical protein BBK14_01860 [Parafrankia soli]
MPRGWAKAAPPAGPVGPVSIRVDDGDLQQLLVASRRFPQYLQDELRDRLGEVADDMVAVARRNALALRLPGKPPSRRPERRSTGLRRELAAGVRAIYRPAGAGVEYRITSSHHMTHATDARYFRHPVFGNREAWVGQASQPWFADPLAARLPRARTAAGQALGDALDKAF